MDPQRRPKLEEILRLDTRVRSFKKGELIVRQGDYGTSAFMILSGSARVVLEPDLPERMIGRKETARKPFLKILAQLWSSRKPPESFSAANLKLGAEVNARREEGKEFRVLLQDIPRVLDKHRTATMGPGEFFGEIAALSRMPRTATIFADEDDTELLEIRWQGFRDLLRYDSRLKEHIDQLYRNNALVSHIRAIPIFHHLTNEQRAQVLAATEFGTFGDYDWSGEYKKLVAQGKAAQPNEPLIAREGDYPNGVVLIRSGFGRVTQQYGRGDRTLNYIGVGQYYGFEEIVHNWRNPEKPVELQRTLRAIGYTHVIIVPTAIMEKVVLPTLPKHLLPPAIELASKEEGAVEAAPRIRPDMMEFLSENRFFNGRATMLIDLDRCTRCDDCVRACATAHDNNPRFLRYGPVHGNLMVANACMHCADPVCLIGCPTGAIHRNQSGGEVVINPITCIGCKMCFNNCPYDAIRMVEIRNENDAVVMGPDMRPIIKATKCDLCIDQLGGPACQRACPHGALARQNLTNLNEFADWVDR